MVLVEEGQILLQALNLHLKVRFGESELIQDSAQAIDVSFNALAKVQFVLIPIGFREEKIRNRSTLCPSSEKGLP